MKYTVRYKVCGYHSQYYNYTDIECKTLAEAISNVKFHGEVVSGTVTMYKNLILKARCKYDDFDDKYSQRREDCMVAQFTGNFVSSKYGYGGWFNFEGLNDIDKWTVFNKKSK